MAGADAVREALEFYAGSQTYEVDGPLRGGAWGGAHYPIHDDKGARARAALEQLSQAGGSLRVTWTHECGAGHELRLPSQDRGLMPCPWCAVTRAERAEADLDKVIFTLLLLHPWPWKVVSDWTEEVVTSDGLCVAKCRTREQADALVEHARKLEGAAGPDGRG